MKHNILIAGSIFTASLAGCSSAPEKPIVKEQPATVAVTVLRKERLSSSMQLPGELQAWQQVDLYAKEASFVQRVYADVGTEVHTGQLLAQMEAPEVNSRMSGAESRFKSMEAIYMASKSSYDRLLETSKTPGTISQNDLDQAAARKNSDYAQLQAARAAYREVGASRDYLTVRAPFTGIVSARNINAGAYVGPSGVGAQTPLFTVQEQQRLRLVVSVPEAYTAYLQNGSEVSFTVKSLPNEVFKAKVARRAGALDARLRSERMEMDVTNTSRKLLPGTIAEVKLDAVPTDSTFTVPKSAVVSTSERVFVIRVNDGKAEWVDVKKGREANGRQEIYGDLKAGDEIVQRANDEIREGQELPRTAKAGQP